MPREQRLATPGEAVAVALEDARRIPPADLPFTRYVFVQSGQSEDFQALSHAVQLISRSAVTSRPAVVGGIVARIDLRWYAPTADDLQEWLDLWEDFQFDSSFSKLRTRDELALLGEAARQTIVVPTWKRSWAKRGDKWVRAGRELVGKPLADLKDVVVIRSNTPTAEAAGLSKLQAAVGSLVPVVEVRYFLGRALSTIKDRDKVKVDGKDVERENVFSTVWGGRYYEFKGIRKSQVKGRTDLDQLLFDRGILEKFEILFERLRSDGRVIQFISRVTGKPRDVIYFALPSAHLDEASPVCFITRDVRDRDVDHGDRVFKSAVKTRPRAYEVLLTDRNGHIAYALYGEEQQLVDEAASEVVGDGTVPPPNTPRLQAARSCVSCHGPHDGWQPMDGDLRDVVRGAGPDIFGDLADKNKPIFDTVDRLAGQVRGDASKALRRAREDNAAVVLK
ncbi:MAG TPA: hypothetical protein VEA69_25185, partial [Tepidisphaeraceae bacterium]|nr:hypothetical protein [Tepidisphaeraceae bacterium]